MTKDEQELKELARKMVEKVKHLKYHYPDITDSIDSLQKDLYKYMKEMSKELHNFPEREKNILTLLIINEIHKTLDEVFNSDEIF